MGLLILFFCCVTPIIPSFHYETASNIPAVFDDAMQRVTIIKSSLANASSEGLSPWLLIYFIGVSLFSIMFLLGIGKIAMLILKSKTKRKWGFKLIELKKKTSPFSFFGYLFIHHKDIDNPEIEPIILHEQFHKNQFHSVDIMLLELLTVFFWFNPFIWLFQKEIKDTHEYMADEHVIKNGIDKLDYQDLLFEARTGISFKSVNYLSNQTSLKQRFNMMEKRRTHSKTNYLGIGSILIAMVITVVVTSFSGISTLTNDSNFEVQIFTKDGEVDLDKGISKESEALFLRMVTMKGTEIAYRITKTETTLLTGDRARWTIQSGEMIQLGDQLWPARDGSIRIDVLEYQTKDKEDRVETVLLEEPIRFKFPVK